MSGLRAELAGLRADLDDELRDAWDRSLPFADALFDRWERARRLGFAEGANIYDSAHVFGDVTVGAGTWVGPFVILDGTGGGLHIGAGCNISAGVHVYTHDTALRCVSGGAVAIHRAPVRIGDATYIGPQSVVAAGVTIGDRCIVGANSFVRSDVPDRTVVAGSPARVVGRVDGDGADTRIVRVAP